MWVAIFVPKEERDLLSLISLGMEFQRNAPSYMKLLFILLVCGWGKQRETDPVLIYSLLSYASKYKLLPYFLICPFLQSHSHSDQSYYRLYLNQVVSR